jgi:hypothetical protein
MPSIKVPKQYKHERNSHGLPSRDETVVFPAQRVCQVRMSDDRAGNDGHGRGESDGDDDS